MAVSVDGELVAHLCAGGGRFVLRGASDPPAALTAMRAGARAMGRIPHPEEPTEPLPNFVSSVTVDDDGPSFWIDVKDVLDDNEALAQQIVVAIVGALDAAGADGELGFLDRREPAAPPTPEQVEPSARAMQSGFAARLLETARGEVAGERRRRIMDWWLREEVPRALAVADVENTLAELPALNEGLLLGPTLEALASAVVSTRARLIDKSGGSERLGKPDVWRQGDRPAAVHVIAAIQDAVGDRARHADDLFIRMIDQGADVDGANTVRWMWAAIWINAAELLWRTTGGAAAIDHFGHGDEGFGRSEDVYNSLERELPSAVCAAAEDAMTDTGSEPTALADLVDRHFQQVHGDSFGDFGRDVVQRWRDSITPQLYGDVVRSGVTALGGHCYASAELLVGGEKFDASFAPGAWERVAALIDELS